MIEEGDKFKTLGGIHVTILKQYNSWGSYIVEMRKLDKYNRVIREGVKLVTKDQILSKMIDFEEDYIKKYADFLKGSSHRKLSKRAR